VGEPEAFERMEVGLDAAPIPEEPRSPLFRPARAARDDGRHGSATRPMNRRAVQAEDQSDVVQTDFREQPLEAEPVLGRGPALALILVDDENAVRGPTEFDGPVDERILAVGGLPVLGDLLDGGLADVDDGQPVGMTRLNLGRGGQPGWR
jgi:hypothetical protein